MTRSRVPTDLAPWVELRDLTREEIASRFGIGPDGTADGVKYQGIAPVTRLSNLSRFPGHFFFAPGADTPAMVYIGDRDTLRPLDPDELMEALGGEGATLRSRAGKRSSSTSIRRPGSRSPPSATRSSCSRSSRRRRRRPTRPRSTRTRAPTCARGQDSSDDRSQSETCDGCSVSWRTRPELAVEVVEVGLVAQAGAERLQRAGRVVLAAVEAAVHELLDPRPGGAEQARDRERRDRHRQARLLGHRLAAPAGAGARCRGRRGASAAVSEP